MLLPTCLLGGLLRTSYGGLYFLVLGLNAFLMFAVQTKAILTDWFCSIPFYDYDSTLIINIYIYI
jgi:hypothetical protein